MQRNCILIFFVFIIVIILWRECFVLKKLSTKILAVLLACILCVMPVFATDITIDDTNATSESTLSVDESKVDAGNSDDVSIEVSDDISVDNMERNSDEFDLSTSTINITNDSVVDGDVNDVFQDVSKSDVDDKALDATIENYLMKYLDSTYVKNKVENGSSFFRMFSKNEPELKAVNAIYVKQTICDASKLNDDDTITSVMKSSNMFDIFQTMLIATVPVYDLNEDSEYYIAFANTMQDDPNAEVRDADFAILSNDGEELTDCIYDYSTGIAYIPKKYLINKEGKQILAGVQIQLLQAVSDSLIEPVSEMRVLTKHKRKLSKKLTTENMYDMESSAVTEKGLSKDQLVVAVNGVPVPDELFSYNSDTGKVQVGLSSAVVQTLTVDIKNKTVASLIKDELKPLSVVASYNADSLPPISNTEITLPTGAVAGSKYLVNNVNGGVDISSLYYRKPPLSDTNVYHNKNAFVIAKYMESGSNSFNNAYGPANSDVNDSVLNSFVHNIFGSYANIDLSRLDKLSNGTNVHVRLKYCNFGDLSFNAFDPNLEIWLKCAHVTDALIGQSPFPMDDLPGGPMDLKDNPHIQRPSGYGWITAGCRILKINKERNYAIISMVTSPVATQSGAGIFKVKIKPSIKYASLSLSKKWVDYDNKYNKRPSSVNFQIYKAVNNGSNNYNWQAVPANQGGVQTISASNGWKKTITGSANSNSWLVAKDNNGVKYAYKAVEINTSYYYSSNTDMSSLTDAGSGGIMITNTFKPIPTSLSVKKIWDDWYDKYGHRPNSVNVGLYYKKQNAPDSSYTKMATATLSASNNWYYEFNSLNTPGLWRKDADGQYWEYTIREDTDLPNYTSSMSWTGNYDTGYKGTLTNRLDVGWAKLQKQSELPAITNDNRCYSLEGAEYWVYTNENLTSWMPKPLVTKADGSTNQLELPVGKYWVKEYKAPKGFKVDENVYPITIKRGETANITSTEPCLNDPGAITMTKTQKGPSTGNLPSLLGTEFTMRYYDGFYTKDELKSQTPKRTWVFAMKWDEKNQRYQLYFNDNYLVKEKSDVLYKDALGLPVLPLGTYALHESQHAPGYIFENGFIQDSNGNKIPTTDVYVTQVKDDKGHIILQGGHAYSSENSPKPTNIRLEKYDETNQPLDGVTFELHKKSDGTLVDTKTTDVNGVVEFNDVYPDTYEVIETKTKDGMQLLAKPIEIKAPMMLTEQEVIDNHIDKNQCSWSEGDQKWLLHTVTYKVTNESNLDLPETGGFGMKEVALPFTIGMILLVGICVLIFMRKRK